MSAPSHERFVRIETPKLVLRRFDADDLADLTASFGDEYIARWNPGPQRAESAAEFMAARNDWTDGTHASWAVADLSNRLIGSVSLHKIDTDQANAEIGYWIAPWGRGRGHATRAVHAACQFAFEQLGLHRVYLYHAVQSTRSCSVARAAGFLQEGTLRQSFRDADGDFHDEHLHATLETDSSQTQSSGASGRNG